MEDKDLDQYFKDRSGAFNEAPGEGLWAKIEANIEPAAPTGSKAGKWLLPGAGIIILTGLVAAWLVTGNGSKQQAPAPKQQQEVAIKKDSILPAKDTIAYNTAEETVTQTTVAAKPVTKAVHQPVALSGKASTTAHMVIDEFAGEETPAAAAGNVNKGNTAQKPADAAVKDSVIAPFTLKGKDMIEVIVTEKITRAERNTLIKSTVEKNAPYVGRKIVIKAKGYGIFRHTITETDYRKYLRTGQDTLPTQKLRTVVVIDTVYYDLKQDTLKLPNTEFNVQPKSTKKD